MDYPKCGQRQNGDHGQYKEPRMCFGFELRDAQHTGTKASNQSKGL